MIPAAIALAAALGATPQVAVIYDAGEYEVTVVAEFDRPRERIYALLTDYANLPHLTDAILSSSVVERRDDGAVVVDTVTRSCSFLFCKTLEHRQVVTEYAPDRIEAVTIAEHSDFESGEARWTLSDLGGRTRLEYVMRVHPDFFVPPLFGPAFVRRALEREGRALVAGIEAASR